MNRIIQLWRRSFDFRTLTNTLGSLLVTVAFALYNGAMGLIHASVWNGSICVYYLLLSVLRGGLLRAEGRSRRQPPAEAEARRWRAFLSTRWMSTSTGLSKKDIKPRSVNR